MDNFTTQEQEIIAGKIKAFEIAEDWIPGIKIIQCLQPFQNLYICSRGVKHYLINNSFFKNLSGVEFQKKIFDFKDGNTCLVGIKETNEPNLISKKIYIRYTYLDAKNEMELVIVKDLYPDSVGSPRLRMYQILPISLQSWAAPKTKKIADEVSFQKTNHKKFSNLTNRNKEVLSLWAQCLKAEEIGEKLFIGVNSVNSHKKRIKEILEISSTSEIIRYGKAFDLF